ncbi:unnamed protein product [Protopolystoma xenopodis]|uniref:Uncharacterized protein n=1 Tax=Protopolystoma xenopodis TaxID=117903 RepID=A0A3S5AY93_9PLAT|nr:unnamed protein product [Protopolystoma xenopodis]
MVLQRSNRDILINAWAGVGLSDGDSGLGASGRTSATLSASSTTVTCRCGLPARL